MCVMPSVDLTWFGCVAWLGLTWLEGASTVPVCGVLCAVGRTPTRTADREQRGVGAEALCEAARLPSTAPASCRG